MSITINNITFDHHAYDVRGDVLYLSVGEPRVPAETDPTPEGHAVDFGANGNVIAMILVNVEWLIERDGGLRITRPDGHVSHDDRSAAFAAAPGGVRGAARTLRLRSQRAH